MAPSMLMGLALRLHGPLQAWGPPCQGEDRPTLRHPTRSGVLGLVRACMGRARDEDVTMFRDVRVHIRVDSDGEEMSDYHTVQGCSRASETRSTIVGVRKYLADSSFTAILAQETPGVVDFESILPFLRKPVFAPYLGRLACPPSAPILASNTVLVAPDPIALFAKVPEHPLSEALYVRGKLTGSRAGCTEYILDDPRYPGATRYDEIRDNPVGYRYYDRRRISVVHVRQ